MSLTISRVSRPDHDLLVTLETYDFEAFGSTGLRTYDLAVMAQAGGLYLAHVGDEIVGGCQLLRMFDEPGFFYVVGIYIRPYRQGSGLGRAFLLALAGEIGQMGGSGFVLTVAPKNQRALGLYRSAGFVEEAFMPAFYGENEDRHILRWCLAGEGLQGSV
jgi:ribosomal protein S18 acetylase RimI-like enzyme